MVAFLLLAGCQPPGLEAPAVPDAKRAEVFLQGAAKAIRWDDARWLGDPENFELELKIASDSYFAIFDALENGNLWLLACFVKNAERGAAAQMLARRNFRGVSNLAEATGSDGAATKHAGSFQYAGGSFAVDDKGAHREGVFLAIVGSESLAPARLAKEQKLRIVIPASAFQNPENPLGLHGPGRIAFKLQRRIGQEQDTISTVVEIEVDFPVE